MSNEQQPENRKLPTLLSLRDVISVVGSMLAITIAILSFSNQIALMEHNVNESSRHITVLSKDVDKIKLTLSRYSVRLDNETNDNMDFRQEHHEIMNRIDNIYELSLRVDERVKQLERNQ